MAEQPGFDPHAVGEMDYPEHNRTYGRFLGFFKYGAIAVVAILIFMATALVGHGGFIGGILLAAIFAAVAVFVLGKGEENSMKH
ncbi:aa3-type cytochrome c oxidase subunit IV [Aureimonas leprariae]|uniref:Aa3-type cytochrome c oxidase subunit IV n=1 Tax=Plantimonas leprariae TaxID=2615207 RepID=A0A7V7PPS5_9HYPH|nr:aa3-type cytochrome c oxidase subunit IV [Aureimonas leprariae]KAB0680014.1 aa3-type cytochrome c oxidase subunit IV [Aureimonas leprariae]